MEDNALTGEQLHAEIQIILAQKLVRLYQHVEELIIGFILEKNLQVNQIGLKKTIQSKV